MRFSGLLCCRLWRGFAHRLPVRGTCWDRFCFRRLPAYLFLRVGWTHVGYSVGVKAIDKVRENSQMIARSATILGITVIGGLIASYVHINVVTSFAIDSTHSVALQQDFFDKVFPNILPMAYTLLMYYFLRVKKRIRCC